MAILIKTKKQKLGKEEGKPGKKEGNYYPINKNQGRKKETIIQ